MGYTHYWTMTRDLTVDEWTEVQQDIGDILTYIENVSGVPLGNGEGKRRSRPTMDAAGFMFNGIGDDAHETFGITRKRIKQWEGGTLGGDFCKTARKPYDIAVTACLCYLDSCLEPRGFDVSSDGHGRNFMDGLEAARQALPRKANVLDIPLGIRQDDRWTGPWVNGSYDSGYEVRFCVDGHGYVMRGEGEWYRFDTHSDLGRFLDVNKVAIFQRGGRSSFGDYGRQEPNIWNASGSFDKARHERIAKAQGKVLAKLFPVDADHAFPPPAFVRPGDLPRPEEAGTFHYSLADLINSLPATAAA